MSAEIDRMITRFAGDGRVRWIGLRPARRAPMQAVDRAEIGAEGLAGDRRASPGKRAVPWSSGSTCR